MCNPLARQQSIRHPCVDSRTNCSTTTVTVAWAVLAAAICLLREIGGGEMCVLIAEANKNTRNYGEVAAGSTN